MFFNYFIIGLLINVVKIPYDRGANIPGSREAPTKLLNDLDFLNIKDKKSVKADIGHTRNILSDGFVENWNILNRQEFSLTLGGDHTVALSSIFATNEYCLMNKQNLGVLWCSAHADFNTIYTSESKNIHGTVVSILCGHTLPMLSLGNDLYTQQIAYFGLRDFDTQEFERIQKYNMNIIETEKELDKWISSFDKIHISFNVDCIDPKLMPGVNTPINNGLTIDYINNMFDIIKKSDKLISMDLVEFNPLENNNTMAISKIVKNLF